MTSAISRLSVWMLATSICFCGSGLAHGEMILDNLSTWLKADVGWSCSS